MALGGVEDRRRQVDVRDEARPLAPAGTPGPRMISGTRTEGSYTSTFPAGMRCSPWKNPLSDVNTISVRFDLAGRVERGDDVADRLVDGEQRLEPLLVVLAHPVRPRRADERRGCGSPVGLSETSASLNEAGAGSGSDANRFRCRGAGTGVAWLAGSPASRGPPLCGARNATERKNGWAEGAWRRISSTAFRP